MASSTKWSFNDNLHCINVGKKRYKIDNKDKSSVHDSQILHRASLCSTLAGGGGGGGDGEGMAVGAVDMGSIAQAHGPLARYVKLRAAHAPGMPGTFSPPPRVSDPDMHHGTCVTHVPWCMPGSLTSGFLWIRWRGNVPGIPSACATHNFTYLVRSPWPFSLT